MLLLKRVTYKSSENER